MSKIKEVLEVAWPVVVIILLLIGILLVTIKKQKDGR